MEPKFGLIKFGGSTLILSGAGNQHILWGMHSIAIILSMATIILCLVIRKSVLGKPAAYFGFVVGILDLIGAYPWMVGTAMVFVSQLAFAAWFIFLGLRVLGRMEEAVG